MYTHVCTHTHTHSHTYFNTEQPVGMQCTYLLGQMIWFVQVVSALMSWPRHLAVTTHSIQIAHSPCTAQRSHTVTVQRVGVITGLPSAMWHARVVDYNNHRVPTCKAPHSQHIGITHLFISGHAHWTRTLHTHQRNTLHRSLFYRYAVHVGVDGTLVGTSAFVYLVPCIQI